MIYNLCEIDDMQGCHLDDRTYNKLMTKREEPRSVIALVLLFISFSYALSAP